MKPVYASTRVAAFGVLLLSPMAPAQDLSTLYAYGSKDAPPALVLHGEILDTVAVNQIDGSYTALDAGPLNPDTPFTVIDSPSLNLSSFNIVINAGPTLAANGPALAAFNAAAALWKQLIADPITVTIDADMASLSAGVLGSTSLSLIGYSYSTIRNAMVADATNEADEGIVAHLPTSAAFSAYIPSGTSLSGNMMATKANLKALGFTGLDGTKDATIKFSTNFAFDYDNSNGVGGGLIDFETVAAHEIGHALGFFSVVDSINSGTTSILPTPLDLFRFRNNVALSDPASEANFETYKRDLVPGSASYEAIFDDLGIEYKMATGVINNTFPGTDGSQASHWKANELSGLLIGLMDPTLSSGQSYGPTTADFRALDVIGYEINFTPVPEVSTLASGVLLLLGMIRRRRDPHAPLAP